MAVYAPTTAPLAQAPFEGAPSQVVGASPAAVGYNRYLLVIVVIIIVVVVIIILAVVFWNSGSGDNSTVCTYNTEPSEVGVVGKNVNETNLKIGDGSGSPPSPIVENPTPPADQVADYWAHDKSPAAPRPETSSGRRRMRPVRRSNRPVTEAQALPAASTEFLAGDQSESSADEEPSTLVKVETMEPTSPMVVVESLMASPEAQKTLIEMLRQASAREPVAEVPLSTTVVTPIALQPIQPLVPAAGANMVPVPAASIPVVPAAISSVEPIASTVGVAASVVPTPVIPSALPAASAVPAVATPAEVQPAAAPVVWGGWAMPAVAPVNAWAAATTTTWTPAAAAGPGNELGLSGLSGQATLSGFPSEMVSPVAAQ